MKNINIIKLFALFCSAVMIVSCSNEDLDRKDGPTVPEGLPVTLKLSVGTPEVPVVETRAVENGDKTFGEIKNVGVLSYNSEGGDVCATYVSGQTTDISFNTKTGNRKTYVLVNLPESLQSEEALKTTFANDGDIFNYQIDNNVVKPTEPTGEEMMMGYVVLKSSEDDSNDRYQSNYTESNPKNRQKASADVISIESADQSFYASVTPPYSHVDFVIDNKCRSLDNENAGIRVTITSISVHNLPTKYSLFPSAWTLSDVHKNAVYIKSSNDQSLEGTNFYMYENAQGVNEELSSADQKTKRPIGIEMPEELQNIDSDPFGNWESLWTNTACTYIQVEGYYAKWRKSTDQEEGQKTVGDIRYRFFLGENNYNSLDVKRNRKYTVHLELSSDAGYNEIKVNWRVAADLKTIGFSRRSVIMDGEGSYVYPFRIINNTDQEVTIVIENYTWGPWKVKAENGTASESGSITGVANKGGTYFEMTSNEPAVVGSSVSGAVSTWNTDDPLTKITNVDQNSPTDKSSLFNKIRRGSIYRERTVTASLGESVVDQIFIRQYPLLYLPVSGASVGKGPYVERIEEEGTVTTLEAAKARCKKLQDFVGSSAAYTWRLPTKDELNMMRADNTKDLLYELHQGSYWTSDGLVDLNGSVSQSGIGYVRCVLQQGPSGSF
ncbi:DUF4906 domain-containing protein [Parabacteroides chongii]|uniref:DUF4906 domain-containing protein n=1 Tax=Parabacteroides chongii TaxID=2685834 RepID=UPI00240DD148|nr:DUF4906 domain-containing protein [Parabacteroides chongii]WFE86722.1 DUF4906 domain-containing protein [Parabacteroides chongii]